MGGPKKTRGRHKKKYPKAFQQLSKQNERQVKYTGGFNAVDVLVALRGLSYDPSTKMTGFQWAREVLKRVFYAFRQQFALVALVMDKPGLVPCYKAPEEKKRGDQKRASHARAVEKASAADQAPPPEVKPYPKTARLTESGVEIPATDDKPATVEMVTMERLLATRGLRAHLLELCKECLRRYGMVRMGIDNGQGKFLIIDSTEKQGAGSGTNQNTAKDWRRFSTPATLFSAEGFYELPTEYDHPFGEADLGMLWWSHIFRDMNCVVDSNDTDQYNAWMSYIAHHNSSFPLGEGRRRGNVNVRYSCQEHGHTHDVCIDDMYELYYGLQADKISASEYALYHAIGGNDFSTKRFISSGISEEDLLAAAAKSKHLRTASQLLREEPGALPTGVREFVWWQVRYPDVQIPHNKKAFNEIAVCIDKFLEGARVKKSSKPLTAKGGDRDKAVAMVIWAWQYFHQAFFWFANAAPCIRHIDNLVDKVTWVPYQARAFAEEAEQSETKRSAAAAATAAPKLQTAAAALLDEDDDSADEGSSKVKVEGKEKDEFAVLGFAQCALEDDDDDPPDRDDSKYGIDPKDRDALAELLH